MQAYVCSLNINFVRCVYVYRVYCAISYLHFLSYIFMFTACLCFITVLCHINKQVNKQECLDSTDPAAALQSCTHTYAHTYTRTYVRSPALPNPASLAYWLRRRDNKTFLQVSECDCL